MQRSGSASKIRTRRRAIGLLAGIAVHLLAGLVLLPVAPLNLRDRAHRSEGSDPIVLIQLVHLRQLADSAQSQSQSQPRDAPKPKPASLTDKPTQFEVASSEPEPEPEPPTPTPPSHLVDDDPLYRVPFRDAVGQADARLRAGLDCEHVDLQQLPKITLDQCAAARPKDAGQPHGPLS